MRGTGRRLSLDAVWALGNALAESAGGSARVGFTIGSSLALARGAAVSTLVAAGVELTAVTTRAGLRLSNKPATAPNNSTTTIEISVRATLVRD